MILYASRTGNVRSIVNRLTMIDANIKCSDIKVTPDVSEPFLLFTYTDAIGKVPQEVIAFMNRNYHLCRGVIASGNTNFGKNFCKAADIIAETYDVENLYKVDLRGKVEDLENIVKLYRERFTS